MPKLFAFLPLVLLATSMLGVSTQAQARAHRRHHHRVTAAGRAERVAIERDRDTRPDLSSRAAYASGYTFGLFDLGISGTGSAISPYASLRERRGVPAGYGFRSSNYYGPGYGYPGY